ncbi:MAG: hypothetical protein Q4E47_03760 [Candidatus Saccharibacteria bacterium]|nr:hypothetical protein [Candidatus Saccharibacteria bacterium]
MFIGEHGRKIYAQLLEKAKKLGRPPTFDEVVNDEHLPHPNEYAYYFTSFSEAIEQVKKDLHFADPKQEGVAIKKRFAPIDPKVQEEQRKAVERYLNTKRFFEEQKQKEQEKARRRAEASKKTRELSNKMMGGKKANVEPKQGTENEGKGAKPMDEGSKKWYEQEAAPEEVSEQSIEPADEQDTEIKEGIGMDSAKETVTREELLQELITVTGARQRFIRFTGADNDLALLNYDKQLYIDLVGGGSTAGIRKAILEETGWVFDGHTNTVKPRVRPEGKVEKTPKPKKEKKPKASKKTGHTSLVPREVTKEQISEIVTQMEIVDAKRDGEWTQRACESSAGSDILKMPKIKSFDKNYGEGFLKKDAIPNFMEVSETKIKTKAFTIRAKVDAAGREQLEIIFNANEVSFEKTTYDDDTCSVKILC